jgi:hypothetical protein
MKSVEKKIQYTRTEYSCDHCGATFKSAKRCTAHEKCCASGHTFVEVGINEDWAILMFSCTICSAQLRIGSRYDASSDAEFNMLELTKLVNENVSRFKVQADGI